MLRVLQIGVSRISILLEIISGNIEKEKLKSKELAKGNK